MIYLAVFLGLAGSLHCIGMCGPFAMMIGNPFTPQNRSVRWINILLYNLGRTITYSLIGGVFGVIGQSFTWIGGQKMISIFLGSCIIISLLSTLLLKKNIQFNHFGNKWMYLLRKNLSQLLFQGKPTSILSVGILNGLLPCGTVYIALAGAVASGTVIKSMVFMALFGVGTIPAMFSVSLLSNLIKARIGPSFTIVVPAMMLTMAILLILRGLEIGIPNISPIFNNYRHEVIDCH